MFILVLKSIWESLGIDTFSMFINQLIQTCYVNIRASLASSTTYM